MRISEINDGMKRILLRANVVEMGTVREVKSRFKDETYRIADATLQDVDGQQIKLTLWNEQVEQIKAGDTIEVENGYATSFKGEIQLNVGKFGKLKVIV